MYLAHFCDGLLILKSSLLIRIINSFLHIVNPVSTPTPTLTHILCTVLSHLPIPALYFLILGHA